MFGLPGDREVNTGIPQEKTYNGNTEEYPLPLAAEGPDYEVGRPYYPVWQPSFLNDGWVEIHPANYGTIGSRIKYANETGEFGPDPASGATYDSTGKVRSLKWDPEPLPGFDPRIQQWNVLIPGSYFNNKIPSVKSHAGYVNSVGQQNPAGPLEYSAPGPATLVGAGLASS